MAPSMYALATEAATKTDGIDALPWQGKLALGLVLGLVAVILKKMDEDGGGCLATICGIAGIILVLSALLQGH